MANAEVNIAGIPKGSSDNLAEEIEKAFFRTTDLGWLDKGDAVLIKPSVNSSHPYPATTHPLAVETVARILKDNGARVIVGDQAGMEWVLQTPNGLVRDSTINCFEKTGIARAARNAQAELLAFEELGWNGYVNVNLYEAKNWPKGFWITEIIDEVDHIVSLPRVSTHTMTGVTLGLKNHVGFLRNDSRLEMHLNGHFGEVFAKKVAGELLPYVKSTDSDLFKMIAEIFLAIRKKFRLVLYAATEVQTTFGPDRDFHIGPLRVQKSYVMKPDPGIILASSDIVAAEVVAIAWLQRNIEATPWHNRIFNLYPNIIRNSKEEYPVMTAPLRDKPVSPWEFPMVKRSMELKLGVQEGDIEVLGDIPGWIRWDLQKRIFNLHRSIFKS